jgi:hypothetical protein
MTEPEMNPETRWATAGWLGALECLALLTSTCS